MQAHTTYLARCELTPAGYARLDDIRRQLNWLYNRALEERKTAYEERKESLSLYAQCYWLTGLRARNEHGLGEISSGSERGMLKRIDEAFKSFYRRVKAGQTPGYPRFRPLSRCVTIDLTAIRGCTVKNGRIKVKGFPRIKIHPHRPLPDSLPRAVRLTKRGRQWTASMVYEVEKAPLEPSAKAAGIDLGVRKRMTLSDGTRYFRAAERLEDDPQAPQSHRPRQEG